MKKAILIGIAGGTGAGKTLVSHTLYNEIGSDKVIIIEQDSYYHDLKNLPLEERARQNFDHPDAFDMELMRAQMRNLLEGKVVYIPIYNYKTHTRMKKRRKVSGHKIILLEGILVLDDQELRKMMDIKVYIDAEADVRFIRRLKRDLLERERGIDSIIKQYEESVKPMHEQFVEPTKKYADIIIPQGGHNRVAIDLLKTKILSLLSQS